MQHPDATSLYVSQVDVGDPAGPRTVISGLAELIPAEQLLNRHVVVLCNLKPAKIRGTLSNGMILCASVAEPRQVEPLIPPVDGQPGDQIYVESVSDLQENRPTTYEIIDPKKKMWEKIQADLATSSNCEAEWKMNALITCRGGKITCQTLKNAPIK